MEKSVQPRNLSRLCIILITAGTIVAGCGTRPIQPSDKHIQRPATQDTAADIPQPLTRSVALPAPKAAPKAETFSVIIDPANPLPAQEILFALARDAKINLDIHPGIQGTVTLNALNQTLPQILTRIAKQVDMRYELDNGNLIVMPDTPYLHSYKIDYVNMERESQSNIITSAQVTSTGTSTTTASGGNNNSSISIKNTSTNHFWKTLVKNIKDILLETDKEIVVGRRVAASQQADTASSEGDVPKSTTTTTGKGAAENDLKEYQTLQAATVIDNPEAGIITVRASGKQHEKIQEFLDQVMHSARRQVMIEATIVEVRLSDNYQQGINWSALIKAEGKRFKIIQSNAGLPAATTAGMLGVITNPTAATIASQISLLESFGTVKVLSSPKLSVLNNQTAVLKVVDNLVYFTIGATINNNTQTGLTTSYTSTPNTIPVGFTMSVTPQISDSDSVLFNLKPSISRVINFVNDPNPDLARANVVSRIPQTQTREMESVLKIDNNQIAVMGGLMQDVIDNLTDAIPGVSRIPLAGELFKQRNDTSTKTELVIFLRPVVIKDASIEGDFSAYRNMLPDQNFFKEPSSGKP
ncbi:MAG: pilus (MSHA type) biogenesis protein MshL [Gallionella sp.]